MASRRSTAVKAGLEQFIKFGMVGGSGVVVNMITIVILNRVFDGVWGISEHDPFLNLFGTRFNIRWYHVMSTIAFLVANLSNYQLNRMWTFKGTKTSWIKGFVRFLTTGLGALVVQQVVTTFLMNPNSPIALPGDVLDNSTGFRNMYYWATVIAILVATPVNFVVNKLWSFRSAKVPGVVGARVVSES